MLDFGADRAFFRSVSCSCQADSAAAYFPEEAGLECLFASLQVGASVGSDRSVPGEIMLGLVRGCVGVVEVSFTDPTVREGFRD